MKSCKDSRPIIPELLAPAGTLEKLKTAVHYGADAVYLGGRDFSLRAKAGNFSIDNIREGVEYAHQHNVKVYVTVNVFAHNDDFMALDAYLLSLKKCGIDGLIVSDPGILRTARRVVPSVSLHLSTQANVTNCHAADFWLEQGVSRLNLARELSFEEISVIRNHVQGELEVFVHGALCISYSGRCMLSNYLTDRDANSGNCSHPCRFSYSLIEEKRPGHHYPVEEDDRGTYIFNSKDLCLLMLLPELVAMGIDSLKIEGRMKSIFYVGGVVRIYRAALDYLRDLPEEAWAKPVEIEIPPFLLEEIEKTGTRGITQNFAKKKPDKNDMLYSSSRADQSMEPVAVLRSESEDPKVEIRNRVSVGEKVEYMGKGMELQPVNVISMTSEKGEMIETANPGNIVYLSTLPKLKKHSINGMIRRKKAVLG